MATTIGKPRPPFLIKAPSGAPTKNKIIQAIANTNLSCKAIICLFKKTSFISNVFVFESKICCVVLAEFNAKLIICAFLLILKRSKISPVKRVSFF